MPNEHKKHSTLAKPQGGQYHRNEWTILGAPCSKIEDLVNRLADKCKTAGITCGYLDMAHQAEAMQGESMIKLTDNLDHIQIKAGQKLQDFDYHRYLNAVDILFVNGNHYVGDNQIVIVNTAKKDSLHRKLDRLTNVKMVVMDDGEENMHDYLEDVVTSSTPRFDIGDIAAISEYIITQSPAPPLYGLVLAGGKSQRMGEDKIKIKYHSVSHLEYTQSLLEKVCDVTYISQRHNSDDSEQVIADTYLDLGPFGGILSAFRYNPNVAWMTLPCDLPHMNVDTLAHLKANRKRSKIATCYYNPETDFPEPLITIWEPRAYPLMLDFLSQGQSCPRKVLINADIEMLEMPEPFRMLNANTQEEKQQAIATIKNLQSAE